MSKKLIIKAPIIGDMLAADSSSVTLGNSEFENIILVNNESVSISSPSQVSITTDNLNLEGAIINANQDGYGYVFPEHDSELGETKTVALDEDIVHNTGDESIYGLKTFYSGLFVYPSSDTNSNLYLYAKNSGTTESDIIHISGGGTSIKLISGNMGNATAGGSYLKLSLGANASIPSEANIIFPHKSGTVATENYVDDAIAALPEPMIFKGSVGAGGTVEWANLPAAGSTNEGFTYKVITEHNTAPICKVGDTIISNGSAWIVIPSGDEPSGTVTSVGTAAEINSGLTLTGGPITSSGTITVGLASGYELLNSNAAQIIAGSKLFTSTVSISSGTTKEVTVEDFIDISPTSISFYKEGLNYAWTFDGKTFYDGSESSRLNLPILSSEEEATIATTDDLTGFVTGPSSASSSNIAVFDGTTGKIIKDSGIYLSKGTSSTQLTTTQLTLDRSLGISTIADDQGTFDMMLGNTTAAYLGLHPYVSNDNLYLDVYGYADGVSTQSSLGTSNFPWGRFYVNKINPNNNGSGYVLPAMSSTATTDKTIATIDDVPTNLENGTGACAVKQKAATGDDTSFITGNSHAKVLDTSLEQAVTAGASSQRAIAFNKMTVASATNAFANGNKTIAKGEESHAEGYASVTLGNGSHAEGNETVAYGMNSHSEGSLTQAVGIESHAEGHDTMSGNIITEEGTDNNIITGKASHAEGVGTKIGSYSFEDALDLDIGANQNTSGSGGSDTPPSPGTFVAGEGSHAEGYNNIVSSFGAHAEGLRNYLNGSYAHIEGVNNTNNGAYSHVEGFNNINNGQCSLISGVWNNNSGYNTFIAGHHNENTHDNKTIIGRYNEDKDTTLFEIGNGYNDGSQDIRQNAFEVYTTGKVAVGASTTAADSATTLVTKDYVDAHTFPNCQATTNGNYILRATVNNGVVTYTWVEDNFVRLS